MFKSAIEANLLLMLKLKETQEIQINLKKSDEPRPAAHRIRFG